MRESTLESVDLSMPTWGTLEDWARSSIQSLLQQDLEEDATTGTYTLRAPIGSGPQSRVAQRPWQASARVVDVGHRRVAGRTE